MLAIVSLFISDFHHHRSRAGQCSVHVGDDYQRGLSRLVHAPHRALAQGRAAGKSLSLCLSAPSGKIMVS